MAYERAQSARRAHVPDPARIFVLTGDEVVRLTLTGEPRARRRRRAHRPRAAVRCRRSARPEPGVRRHVRRRAVRNR